MTAIVRHCSDSFAYLATLPPDSVDVILTDPPYTDAVQKNLCSGSLVGKKSVPKYTLPFNPLTSDQHAWVLQGIRVAKRWVLTFCALESFGLFKEIAGESYVRSSIWYKSNCLPGRALLYARTASGDGPAKLEHLVRLPPQSVQLWNGKEWSKVVRWTPSPNSPTLKITLRSGEKITCTRDHEWPTKRGLIRASDLIVGDTLESTQLPEPDYQSTLFDTYDMGWFIGTFLADGSFSGSTIQISSHIKEIARFESLKKIANDWGARCPVHQTTDNGCTVSIFSPVLKSVIKRFIGGKNAHTKGLLPPVWRSSNAFLKGLWQGYLDGDGHWDERADLWQLRFCRNLRLASDLRTLCARLGWDIRLRPRWAAYQGGRKAVFIGTAREIRTIHFNAKAPEEVVQISVGRTGNCWDVTVADSPNLFALSSGVLTHNSMGQLTRDRPATAYEGIAWLHGRQQDGHPKKRWNGRGSYGIWRCNGTRGKADKHPNEKPLDLCLKLVALASERGETIFDPFCGSGAIGEACILLGRNYIGFDSDPAWVQKAQQRLDNVRGSVSDDAALALCTMPRVREVA